MFSSLSIIYISNLYCKNQPHCLVKILLKFGLFHLQFSLALGNENWARFSPYYTPLPRLRENRETIPEHEGVLVRNIGISVHFSSLTENQSFLKLLVCMKSECDQMLFETSLKGKANAESVIY